MTSVRQSTRNSRGRAGARGFELSWAARLLALCKPDTMGIVEGEFRGT